MTKPLSTKSEMKRRNTLEGKPMDEGIADKGLEAQLEDVIEVAYDLFNQACKIEWDHKNDKPIFDHMCLSVYENAQAFFIKIGRISEDQCRRK